MAITLVVGIVVSGAVQRLGWGEVSSRQSHPLAWKSLALTLHSAFADGTGGSFGLGS